MTDDNLRERLGTDSQQLSSFSVLSPENAHSADVKVVQHREEYTAGDKASRSTLPSQTQPDSESLKTKQRAKAKTGPPASNDNSSHTSSSSPSPITNGDHLTSSIVTVGLDEDHNENGFLAEFDAAKADFKSGFKRFANEGGKGDDGGMWESSSLRERGERERKRFEQEVEKVKKDLKAGKKRAESAEKKVRGVGNSSRRNQQTSTRPSRDPKRPLEQTLHRIQPNSFSSLRSPLG